MAQKNYLITGVPGAGKSTLCEALQEQGFNAIDTDLYPDFSNWFSKETGVVVRRPDEGVSSQWLSQHSYDWDKAVLRHVLDEPGDVTFICGSSSNQDKLVDWFDKVFLLVADEHLVIDRLSSRHGSDHYGQTADERNHVLTWYQGWQDNFIKMGAVAIDASQPVETIVATIKKEIS